MVFPGFQQEITQNTIKKSPKFEKTKKTSSHLLKNTRPFLKFRKRNHHTTQNLKAGAELMKKFSRKKTCLGHSTINACVFDKTGEFFITGGDDGKVKVWSILNGSLQGEINSHVGFINDIVISNCNKYIISGDEKGVICISNILELNLVKKIDFKKGQVDNVFLIMDDKLKEPRELLLCTGGSEGTVTIFDLSYLKENENKEFDWRDEKFCLLTLESNVTEGKSRKNPKICTVRFALNYNIIFAGSYTGEIVMFKLNPKDKTYKKVLHKCMRNAVHLVEISKNEEYISVGAAKSGAKLWKIPEIVENFEELQKPKNIIENDTPETRMYRLQEHEFSHYKNNRYAGTDAMSWSRN